MNSYLRMVIPSTIYGGTPNKPPTKTLPSWIPARVQVWLLGLAVGVQDYLATETVATVKTEYLKVDSKDATKAIRRMKSHIYETTGSAPDTLLIGRVTLHTAFGITLDHTREDTTVLPDRVEGLVVLVVPWLEGFLIVHSRSFVGKDRNKRVTRKHKQITKEVS